jgi:succinate dehydrogenase/fumarate reductase flavoprotein subunit
MTWYNNKKQLSSAITEWKELREDYKKRVSNEYKKKDKDTRLIIKINQKILSCDSIIKSLEKKFKEQFKKK